MNINAKANGIFREHLESYSEQYLAESYPQWKAKHEAGDDVVLEPIAPEDLAIMWEDAAANDCESPIEQMLLASLMFCSTGYGPWPVPVWNNAMPFRAPSSRIFVSPQFKFGSYRLDLALFGQDFSGNEFRFAIECDGHEFHKTKDQMKRDRKRARFLQLWGWHIIRFTGSEIFADADGCAEEVGELACQVFDEDFERRGEISNVYKAKKLQEFGFVSPFIPTQQEQAA
jgi:very-short-patch-repair endonuclease